MSTPPATRRRRRRRMELVAKLRATERRLSFLLDTATAMAGASDFTAAVERLAAAAVPELGDICFIDSQGEDGRPRRLAAAGGGAELEDMVRVLRHDYPLDLAGIHPAAVVLRTGRPSWGPLTDDLLRASTRDARHYEITRSLGFHSYLSVPLLHDGAIRGALTLVSAGSGREFNDADRVLAEELASRVSQVLAATRRFDREHRLAHDLQARLLPTHLPQVPGALLAFRYLASTQGAEVGGDFYDAILLPSGRLGFVIGDVAGHDAGAAARMGQLRSAARVLSGMVREPALLVDRLQWSWDLLGFDRIATALFGRIDPASGVTVLASAGHPPPLLITASGASYLPVIPSPPLGAPSAPAGELTFTVPVGASLLLFTDGLIERRHESLDAGLERLAVAAAAAPQGDPEALCEAVLASLGDPDRRPDDVAILAISRT
ncbi:MAG: PP2C family protein-serine/threonine phosphatase [Acidimicrobiales bacterium]